MQTGTPAEPDGTMGAPSSRARRALGRLVARARRTGASRWGMWCRARLRWRVVVAALLVTVLAGGAFAWSVARTEGHLAEIEALATARADVVRATRDLAGAVATARSALSASADRVDDERERRNLAAALDDALAAADGDVGTVDAAVTATARLVAAHEMLDGATDAVTAAVAARELRLARAAWTAAAERLAAVITAARDLLAASAARVADETSRRTLAEAIDAAQAEHDAAAPGDVASLTAAADALGRATGALDGPRAAVSAAVDQWEAAAAASAARARAKATLEAEAAKGGAGRSASKAPPNGSSGGAAAQPAPSRSPSDGSHWEETVTYEDMAVCGDETGDWRYCSP